MTFSRFRQRASLAALFALAVLSLGALTVSAQQITYYNFNTPATSTQYSYQCLTSVEPFCFNYTGSETDPIFIQDSSLSNNYVAQLTYPHESQGASMWYSVPQKVAGGFNAWFQFKITAVPGEDTADGFAFVIQNAQGSTPTDGYGRDPSASCIESGSGPDVVGSSGGCMGYGGIDNSVALEFDTYDNSNFGDPGALGPNTDDDNHIALQDCGPGQSNSPVHTPISTTSGPLTCLVSLGATSTLISNPLASSTGSVVRLADGNVHDVVIVYNGPLDTPANTLSVYIDPTYNPGTHTPVAGSVPIFTGSYDITQALNLLNSGSANDSAYIGFTSGTGSAFETHEIVAWTFTPHSTVSQQQPLAPAGTPTTYNFGTHSYTVLYPADADTSNVGMGVIANTISPTNFANLLGFGATQYAGSQCQVYDDTGGNCIIYSTYCYNTQDTSQIEACPAGTQSTICTDPNQPSTGCITLTSSYNNSIAPVSPGFLQGDPLYSPVSSISGNGTTTTVTCVGECAVTAGQTVTILNANVTPLFTGVTVAAAMVNSFTFANNYNETASGGYVTSNNAQDIFTSYSPQNLDGTTTGKTTNFSDFVVTGTTIVGTTTSVPTPSGTVFANQQLAISATVSSPATGPTGLPLLSAYTLDQTPVSGTVNFSDSYGAIAACQSVPLTNGVAQCSYTPTTTGPDTVTAQYSGDPYHQGSSGSTQSFTVSPPTVQVTIGTSPAGLTWELNGTPYTSSLTSALNVGTNYTLYAPPTQTLASVPNTQYVFSSWSNGAVGTNTPTDVVTVPATPTAYTANFTTQYLLSATAGTGGTVTVANGYYNAGTAVGLVATPNAGYVFSGWTPVANILNPASASTTITMNAPELIAASFTPVPMASVSPMNIDFGTLYLGSIVTQEVTVSNTGAAPMTISDPWIAIVRGGNSDEFITVNLCPKSLAAGKSCIMTVTFIAGPFYTPQTATLVVNDNASGGSQTVTLTATVIDPLAVLSSSSLSFGTEKVGSATASKSITLSNPGGTALSIGSIAMGGVDPQDFSIVSNTCSTSLAAGKSCAIGVSFKPTAKGSRTASLVVTDNAQSSSQTVSLTGTGD